MPTALITALGGIAGLFGKGGAGAGGVQSTNVSVGQTNSQSQSLNIGSNPVIPPVLSGNVQDSLDNLFASLGISNPPSGVSIADPRYSTQAIAQQTPATNWTQILLYVLIGLAAYYLIVKFKRS
jgi:hypothetical protein